MQLIFRRSHTYKASFSSFLSVSPLSRKVAIPLPNLQARLQSSSQKINHFKMSGKTKDGLPRINKVSELPSEEAKWVEFQKIEWTDQVSSEVSWSLPAGNGCQAWRNQMHEEMVCCTNAGVVGWSQPCLGSCCKEDEGNSWYVLADKLARTERLLLCKHP